MADFDEEDRLIPPDDNKNRDDDDDDDDDDYRESTGFENSFTPSGRFPDGMAIG